MTAGETLKKQGEALKKQLEELSQLVVVPSGVPTTADAQDALRALAGEKELYANLLNEENLADRRSARTQREKYARRIFVLVCVWIILIFVLLLCQGFGDVIRYKPLSDKVLIALITSTTVNVIGTLIIVLKYIFKVSGHPPSGHSAHSAE
jgi:hypothetical protein